MLRPILVLCLGNEVLSDDAFGPRVAGILSEKFDFGNQVEVTFAPLAGFNLLDLLHSRRAVLIVDTILTGQAEPGTIHYFPLGYFSPSLNLTCSHQISLPTALELGKRIGLEMPEEIDVLAVEAGDVETLSESLTPPVENAIDATVNKIREWIEQKQEEGRLYEYGAQKSPLA